MKNLALRLRIHAIVALLVLVILTIGLYQAEAIIVLGFSPDKFVGPDTPPIGSKVEIDITLKDFDGTQGKGDLAGVEFYVDYDSTVVTIDDPSIVTGDVDISGFESFGVDEITVLTKWVGVTSVTSNEALELDPQPSDFEHPENVNRFMFGYADKMEQGVINSLVPPATPEEATPLITISFRVLQQSKTPVIFLVEKGKFVDSSAPPQVIEFIRDSGELMLPVILSASGAIWHMNEGVKIFWEAESQQENLGWNIYRSETKDGKFVKINGDLIKGAGTTANPMKYSFIDKDAKKGKIYYYYLEDISFNGEKHRTDDIKSIPVNKITSWGAIKNSVSR
jgi:hypothetical protein